MSTNEEGKLLEHSTKDQPLVVQRAHTLEKSDAERVGAGYLQPAAEPAVNASNYLHAVRRHWLLGLVLGVIVAAVFGAATFLLVPRYYTPYAFVKVALKKEVIVEKWGGARVNRQDYEVFKNTQLGWVKSPLVLLAALRPQKIANLSIVQREKDPLTWLEDELKVGYINESEMMRVSLTDTESQEAADLVNAVVRAYIAEVVVKEETERKRLKNKLTQIYNSMEYDVRTKRSSLNNLAEQLNALHSEAVQTQSTVNIRELYDLRAMLNRMKMDLGKAEGALKAGEAMLERLDDTPVSEIELAKLVRADPICKQHSEMIAVLRPAVTQQNQMAVSGIRRSSVDRLAMQLETAEQEYTIQETELRELIKGAKRAEIEEQIAAAQVQFVILTKQVADMSALVAAQKEKVSEIGKSSVEIDMMVSDLKTLEQNLAEISDQLAKLDVESQARARIMPVQDAQEPGTVDKPKLALILAIMTAGIGFILPFSGIVWWDIRNKRVNSTEDVARGLGLPVIGSVPTIPGRAIRRLGSSSNGNLYWNVRLTESIDGIAAKLLRNATIDDKRIILITSAVSGECKTTLATQIAMSLARAGRRTVLVDFDLRNPAINRSFQLDLDPGVSEFLCGEVNVRDAVSQIEGLDNLFVLTAGRSDHHALQALANGKDQLLFDELREDFEFVIIDGSPILPVADSRYLSQHVDTVVLSVFRDFSRMPKVVDACEILESFGVTDLDTVVTSTTEVRIGIDQPVEA